MVCSLLLRPQHVSDQLLGITPFVNPDDLKFFFQEIHRLTKTDAQ